MGSSGGSQSSSQKTTQTVEPPGYVKPYAEEYLGRALPLSETGYEAYPYSRVSDLTPEHMAGLQQVVQQGLQGDPGTNLARNTYGQTVRGDFLNANPYLDSMYDQAAQGMVNQYRYADAPTREGAASFARALGGSADQQYGDMQRFSLGQNLNNLATQIYGGNYAAERGYQNQAMAMAPQMNEIGYRDSQALLGAGDIFREQNQALINQDYEDYEKQRLWPYSQLDILGNALGVASGGGGSTVTTQPSFFQPNRAAGALGGGLLGYGVGQAMDMSNPYLAAGAGALGGYLL